MSFNTTEPAIADPASDLAASVGSVLLTDVPEPAASGGYSERSVRLAGGLDRLRADAERMAAVRDSWRALWSSRLLVWLAGVGAVGAFGFGPAHRVLSPSGLTHGFGRLGDLLAAPAARWDAAWYLVIAHYGYRPDLGPFTASRTAFFPLYPFGLSVIEHLGLAPVPAGVLLSIGALAVALYGLHRLMTLEVARLSSSGSAYARRLGATLRGGDVARLAVMLTAFAPMAFYFSAVYSESLYLALSIGVFLFARRGRWAIVAMLGALAAATRSTGVLLLVPAVMLYLYGPREDRPADYVLGHGHRPDAGERAGERFVGAWSRALSTYRGALHPRYRPRRDVLWLALIPAGLGLYMAYLWLGGGDALSPLHAQSVWDRHFVGPYLGVWDGAKAAFDGLRQLLSLQRHHVYFAVAAGSPFINAGHNLLFFAFLVAAVPAVIGCMRLLPPAYVVYVLAALALPLSYPVVPQPLMSLPRFLVVLFPLNMWLALRLSGRPRARVLVLAVSAVAMMFFVAEFATWHWVA